MADKPDGGPAFPTDEYYDEKRYAVTGGMTLRDYFAAHAPKRPQPWFAPVMPPKPEPIYDHEHGAIDSTCYGYDGMQVCSAVNAKERTQWDVDCRREYLIQWPYAWADMMLKERET